MVMDIERVQKIGKLAQELVSHGMAEDMTVATKQAEQMMGKTNESIPTAGSSSTSSISPTSTIENTDNNDNELTLKLRKMNYQMNEQASEIKNLKEQLFQVTKDLTEMKNTKHIIEKPCDKPQTTLSPEAEKPAEPQVAPAQHSNPNNSGQGSHARTGEYKPGDVSVEKYFYCGGK